MQSLSSSVSAHARVVLVGFEDQDNLGLRYLSSRLKEQGHTTRLVTIKGGPGPVLQAVNELNPQVVGFSLIFQFLVPQFAALLSELRDHGVTAHFTMGGHYASFEPALLLKTIPELDSVVRFEGEDTLLELAERIAAGEDWSNVRGIAHRTADGVASTPGRVGRTNLDELPWPDRDDIAYDDCELPTASIIGSRGCPWRCSFCSIITFYEGNGTKGRRRRAPASIVDELEYLYQERGVRIILWQDDDFLAGGPAAVRWAHAIAGEAIRRKLDEGLRWKISCRSDEVSLESLEPLVAAGLTHVYMGVEAGDEVDLAHLNKHLEPSVHLRAGEVLRALDLSFDFGFMILEPWSTITSVKNNLTFLREFAGDGATPISFCRTLPYAGTPLETRLRSEGRLTALDFTADYKFLDPRLDQFYEWALGAFAERNHSPTGTANILRLLLFEARLRMPGARMERERSERIKQLCALSNRLLLDTAEIGLNAIEGGCDQKDLEMLSAYHASEDRRLKMDLASSVWSAATCRRFLLSYSD
jgi:anaerobic magnesium-protoporphyrin IX monomethyl ester cyclase